jgi:hypothetical protein
MPEALRPHVECALAASVEAAMHWLRASLLGSTVLLAIACSVETRTVSAPAATEPEPTQEEEGTEPVADAGKSDTGTPTKDAAPDVAPKKAEWTAGESGKSCAEACKAKGKTCAVACTDHRSCGGHDGKPPPYAGYACYYYESKGSSSGSSFRSNDGRSLKTCDEVATSTWEYYGDEYKLGDYLGGNPVSCCCQ